MKLSCLPVSLFKSILQEQMSLGEWAGLAGDLGLDGFDISNLFLKAHTPTAIDAVLDSIRDKSATPVMITAYPDCTHPDPMERRRQLDYLRRDMALASALGFPYVRITAGQDYGEDSLEKVVERVLECFREVAEIGRIHGVRPVFENHAIPVAWTRVDFSFRPEAFLKICEGMRGMDIGVNFDTANAVACGADPAALLEQVADQVETVHLNDSISNTRLESVLLGTGLVDFERVFQVLRRIGFNGWVCIEEASGKGVDGMREAIAFARKFVQPESLWTRVKA